MRFLAFGKSARLGFPVKISPIHYHCHPMSFLGDGRSKPSLVFQSGGMGRATHCFATHMQDRAGSRIVRILWATQQKAILMPEDKAHCYFLSQAVLGQ